MDACDLVCELVSAIPVVVAVVGLIAWMAWGFEQASRENDWPPLRRESDDEPRGRPRHRGLAVVVPLRRAGDDELARSVAPPDTGGVGSAPTPAMRATRAPGGRK